MRNAVEKGLAFLAAAQDDAGFWEDWDLPVGSSRLWTTAYVGWRLCDRPNQMSDRAADWLEVNELEGGGWGYSESTGADADSTALGILFLSNTGRMASNSAVQRLLSYTRNDGGFATYGHDQSFGAWTASNVEVSATAALALQTAGRAPAAVERAKTFLRSKRRGDGLWNSYWWNSPLYATEVSSRLLEEPKPLALVRGTSPFDRALYSLATHQPDPSLAAAQLPDGSWESVPMLRVSRHDVVGPQLDEKDDPCFQDPRRIFTTATVLAALIRYSPAITLKTTQDAISADCSVRRTQDLKGS